MNSDQAVVLRTYPSEAAASIAASRLEFEGVEVHLQKDDCGGAYPSLQMCRGVRLLVKSEDLEDAEKIVSKLDAEESRTVESETERRDRGTRNSSGKTFELLVPKNLPSQELDELKTVIFTYVVIAPLLSALFADKIDNVFVACLLFVGLVGASFLYLRQRLDKLEMSLKEQERRLMEREGVDREEFE